MKTIKKISLLALLILFSNLLYAQDDSNKIGIGYSINQFQNDFGLGLHLVSPYFADGLLAVRLGANIQWLEHIHEDEMNWTAYPGFQLGLRGRQFIVGSKISIYGEGGFLFLIPNEKFSTESGIPGGYGVFGFEFFPISRLSYFIEMGGIGTGAVADEVPGSPIYSNGFLTMVGFRVHL